jgi:DNA-binding response OmpR family regulator/putative methionine-R-sulfoxide reductase with GAF domain
MADGTAGILVVDDERFFREAIAEVLANDGLECALAETGEQALDMAADRSLGVVVLDIRLPDIDGIEVLRRLREMRPTLRVIMLSASTDQELVLEALRVGACDYLAKPLHEEELVLAARRALDAYSVNTEWVRLRGRLGRMVARMEELASELAGVRGEARRQRLHDGAVRAVSEVLEAERTSLMLLDSEGTHLEVVAAVGHELPIAKLDRVGVGEGVAGSVLARGEPMVVRDVSADPLFSGLTHMERYRSRSFAVAPLVWGGRAIGVLCATDRPGAQELGSEDLSLLRMLAMQVCELVLANDESEAVLTPAQQAEVLPKDAEDADELDRDAEIARQVCQAIVDEVEPTRLIQAALAPVAALLPAAPVSLFLLDPASGELIQEGDCDGGVSPDRVRIDKRRGLTGSVLQTGGLVATPDPAADSRFDAEVDTPANGQPRPYLCLPLRLRGKTVGVLRAFLQEGADASARSGEVIAAAMSAAVRNVLLYRSLVESIEEVAEARRTARR